MLIDLFGPTRFEYSYLGASATATVRLVRALNTSQFYDIQLIIRIHSLSISLATQSFTFVLSNTLPCESDPREFSEDPTVAQYLSLAVDTSSPASPVAVSKSATNPGAFLKLSLVAAQGGVASTTMYGEFSGVLVGRPR
ncbi:hypothetical protein [Nannocystis sp.]|uniref:hypothetical protein n=1 Tax=Nannocystis sp. TaxID=1962667 RepID=UPI0025FBDA36|nr:hypothetical protein [Nannocystis sp.]MBK7826488.1 hypothetical protein [Nannocystis sp.]